MRLKQDVSERVSERVLHFAATVVVVLIAAAAAHDVGAAVVVAFEISAHILRRLT